MTGRIEPTLGDLELKVDPIQLAETHRAQEKLKRRTTLRDGFFTSLLYLAILAGCYWLALKIGLLPLAGDVVGRLTIPAVMILIGFSLAIGAQGVGMVMLFRRSFIDGVLALLLPGYFLFALERNGLYRSIVGVWALGLLLIAAGTIVFAQLPP
jgi:hypothetical protein